MRPVTGVSVLKRAIHHVRNWISQFFFRVTHHVLVFQLRKSRTTAFLKGKTIDLLERPVGDDFAIVWPISEPADKLIQVLFEEASGEKDFPHVHGGYLVTIQLRDILRDKYGATIAHINSKGKVVIEKPPRY